MKTYAAYASQEFARKKGEVRHAGKCLSVPQLAKSLVEAIGGMFFPIFVLFSLVFESSLSREIQRAKPNSFAMLIPVLVFIPTTECCSRKAL